MFLRRLLIQSKDTNIREISFHKGVNLIVDESPETEEDSRRVTGNNVGKTTVLRLVDYCLGGDGKNIYMDTEFSTQSNTRIKDFLERKNITVSIELADNIANTNVDLVIRRNFLQRTKKIQEINGKNIVNPVEFEQTLQEIIFSTRVEKPTFRQIISRNIRDEKNKVSKVLKVLHPCSRKEEYEALYLFWLGIPTDFQSEKQKLSIEKGKEEHFQNRLKKDGDISLIEQHLSLTCTEIKQLEEEKNRYGINEDYGKEIEELNGIKQRLNQVSTNLSSLEVRKALIHESAEELKKEQSHVDTSRVKELYEKAKSFIPHLQKSFEETVKFHNDLIREKTTYILNNLPKVEEAMDKTKKELSELTHREAELTAKLKKSDLIESLEAIIERLNRSFEEKGKLEQRKKLWQESSKRLEQISEKLEDIQEEFKSKGELIENKLKEFNEFFAKISDELYGERYLLSSEPDKRGFKLKITNLIGNPSTGKKKGQIAAFDLAYIQFADQAQIPCLHFVMHDQLESVHDNQLNTLVRIMDGINGQFIVPILRDKVPPEIDVDLYKVLVLSQKDKLFRLE
jgi:uncharacterized protein YydD (DUF2326 family)